MYNVFILFVLGGNSLDLTLFGGTGGGGPIGSPGGSGTPTAPINLISPSSSNQATSQLPVSQSSSNTNNSPYTNGRPPGSVALPGIHSVAARAAFINAGKSREEGVNHLCSPQNVNGKRLPGLADLVTGGNNGFKTSVNGATNSSVITTNVSSNNHLAHLSDHLSSSVTKSSSVSVSSTSETTVTRVAVMNMGANRNVSSAASGGSNSAIYSPEPPPPPMPVQQQAISHASTTNGNTNMSNSSSMIGVNGGMKLQAISSPMEHQPIHQAMLFGSASSSSNVMSGIPSTSAGMMIPLPPVETSSADNNGVKLY